jgi:isopenicillin-N epimerase
VDPVTAEAFGLDPEIAHLNHGAFGVAPVAVRRAAQEARDRAERNPHRFNRVQVHGLVAEARERAAAFLRLDPARCAWVRNVSEGTSAVLASLDLRPGDELLASVHGYGAVRMALEHRASRCGARVTQAVFPVGAGDAEAAAAFAAAAMPRTRLAVVDRVTSPTAAVLPVAAVAAAVRERAPGAVILADAAHAPGHLDDDIPSLGADHWVGNLHKWAYAPRGSAVLWSAPGADIAPGVLSWQLHGGYAPAFDYPGTWDYAGWLAAPAGLEYWAGLGGWDRVAELSALARAGQELLAGKLGVPLAGLPASPAPLMRLVPLPGGAVTSQREADALYEALSARKVEAAPVLHAGRGYLRVAAAPYNTLGDYGRLADAALAALADAGRR